MIFMNISKILEEKEKHVLIHMCCFSLNSRFRKNYKKICFEIIYQFKDKTILLEYNKI